MEWGYTVYLLLRGTKKEKEKKFGVKLKFREKN